MIGRWVGLYIGRILLGAWSWSIGGAAFLFTSYAMRLGFWGIGSTLTSSQMKMLNPTFQIYASSARFARLFFLLFVLFFV